MNNLQQQSSSNDATAEQPSAFHFKFFFFSLMNYVYTIGPLL